MIPLLPRQMTPAESTFYRAAPPGLYMALHSYLSEIYPETYRELMLKRSEEAAMDELPHSRRSRIQSDLPAILKDLGIQTTIESFPKTTATYLLAHLSPTAKFVICYVPAQGEALRDAKARQELAEKHNAQYLLSPTAQGLTFGGRDVYGVVAHFPHPKDKGTFGGADIIFPSPTGGLLQGCLDVAVEMEKIQIEKMAKATEKQRKVAIKLKQA